MVVKTIKTSRLFCIFAVFISVFAYSILHFTQFVCKREYLTNIKIFRVDIQLYEHEWKLGKREIVWKHDA